MHQTYNRVVKSSLLQQITYIIIHNSPLKVHENYSRSLPKSYLFFFQGGFSNFKQYCMRYVTLFLVTSITLLILISLVCIVQTSWQRKSTATLHYNIIRGEKSKTPFFLSYNLYYLKRHNVRILWTRISEDDGTHCKFNHVTCCIHSLSIQHHL